jgi:beta-glucosidase-like glycosyl hydrolase/CubicO group peptidase (beta-lactamase class C family)
VFVFVFFLWAQGPKAQTSPMAAMDPKEAWVSEKLNALTLEEKIGQLMMVRAHSDKGQDHIDYVTKLVKDYKVGSLCFFQGTPQKQAELTNTYQGLADIPLLVAIDGEWGLGMRFKKDVTSYPRQLTLGAINDNQLIYEMGKQVAYDLKRIGVHLNFAPVVDVNNNPANPVINNRSFGEDKENVSIKSFQYARGMEDAGVMACAKHFPGHGDTNVDSHYDLPVLNFNRKRLDSLELYPFQYMINKGISSIMVAHLSVPVLDNRENRPTSLSYNTVTSILRDSMGFNGLVITDGMEMEGVTKHFPPGVAEAEAILAGNDIICLPRDAEIAIKAIKRYVDEGFIQEGQIDASVSRILRKKYEMGLKYKPRIMINDINKDLLRSEGVSLKSRILAEAITIVSDKKNIIPFVEVDTISYASLAIGSSSKTDFQKRMDGYAKIDHFQSKKDMSTYGEEGAFEKLKKYDRVIIALHDMSKYERKQFGVTRKTRQLIDKLSTETEVVLVLFGSPYALTYFQNHDEIIVSYTEDSIMQDRTAQAIFGADDIRGKLPVSVGKYKYGEGVQRETLGRLGYVLPSEVGMMIDSLRLIDNIVEEMIAKKAAPGCQILVAKDGKVVWHKAYGKHTYDGKDKVKIDDIYDVASITKIAATTVSIMDLYEEGKVDLDKTMNNYISEIDTTNKKNLTLREMMTHHAGLAAWIPFYVNTIDPKSKKRKTLEKYYRRTVSDSFNIEVANNLYLRYDYPDTIWSRILASDLRDNKKYKYSDLGFYFAGKTVERQSGLSLNDYSAENFYSPLGMRRTGFNPKESFKTTEIVPSEKDSYFRNQVIHGHVHDMGAAMLGGVSGHAGMFTTSHDLAILMQMLLNGGNYGGKTYLSPQTIMEFTTRYKYSTRRGVGFDMKQLDLSKYENMSEYASVSTFGHLGFTGTCAFVDPEHNLVYILLSNRTFPTMENNKFGKKNYRPRIQSTIYKSLEDFVAPVNAKS